MIDKATISNLLCRDLNDYENRNFNSLVNITLEKLQEMLCIDLSDQTVRTYAPRYGYSSLIIDPFQTVTEVKVGTTIKDLTKITVLQNDKYNGTWYNTLQFEYPMRSSEKITVTGDWGFGTIPADLQLLMARIFASISKENSGTSNVKSKQIEGYSVTYDTSSTTYDQLLLDNASVISKYSQCDIGEVQHGDIFCELPSRTHYY